MRDKHKHKIFFQLKDHSLVQKVLIDALIKKYPLKDLAILIGISHMKLSQVQNGHELLECNAALKLIDLFYAQHQ